MEKEVKTAGELKIEEYANRIKSGESVDSILDGLPSGMRQAVEEKVHSQSEKSEVVNLRLPPQYEGLPAEIIEELWTIPVYVDPEKTKTEMENKKRILDELRRKETEKEITDENINLRQADDSARLSRVQRELNIQPEIKKFLLKNWKILNQ